MPNNQNPVFTDEETILGDGTEEHPLMAAGSGGGAVVAKAANSSRARIDIPGNAVGVNIDTLSIDIPAGNFKVVAYANTSLFVVTPVAGPGNSCEVQVQRGDGTPIAVGIMAFSPLDNPSVFQEVNLTAIGTDDITGPISGQVYNLFAGSAGNEMSTDAFGWSIELIPV